MALSVVFLTDGAARADDTLILDDDSKAMVASLPASERDRNNISTLARERKEVVQLSI